MFLNRNFTGGPMNMQADRRKEDIRWCTKMQRVCVNVCFCVLPVHSRKFVIDLFTSYILDATSFSTSGGLFYAANLGVLDIMKQLLGKHKADALIEEAWSNLWLGASPRNLHFANPMTWCHDHSRPSLGQDLHSLDNLPAHPFQKGRNSLHDSIFIRL